MRATAIVTRGIPPTLRLRLVEVVPKPALNDGKTATTEWSDLTDVLRPFLRHNRKPYAESRTRYRLMTSRAFRLFHDATITFLSVSGGNTSKACTNPSVAAKMAVSYDAEIYPRSQLSTAGS